MADDKIFSDRPEDDFEMKQMKKKMEKMLNNKGRKTKNTNTNTNKNINNYKNNYKNENYKNIELFENIYETNILNSEGANVEPFTATSNTTIDDLLSNVDLNIDVKQQLEDIKKDLSKIKDVATSNEALTYVDELIQPIVKEYKKITSSFGDAKCKKPVLPYIPFFTELETAIVGDKPSTPVDKTEIPSQVDDFQKFDKNSKKSVFNMGDIPGFHPWDPDTGYDPNKSQQKCTACNDWTGMDNIDDTGANDSDIDFIKYIIEWINFFHDTIIYVECIIARNITKWLSGNEFVESDVDIVKKYVTWGLVIYISSYFVYNWFYLTFFKEFGEKVKIYEISEKNYEQFTERIPFLKMFDSFFTPSLFFTEKVHQLCFQWAPALNDKDHLFDEFFSSTFMFVVLYYLTVYVLYYQIDYFYVALIDILKFNYNNPFVSMMFMVSFFVIIYKIYKSMDFAGKNNSLDMINVLVRKVGLSNPIMLFMYAIAIVLYVILLMVYTPLLSSLIFVVFLFLFLFFYMALFTRDGYTQNCYEINTFIDKVLDKNRKEKMSVKLSLIENVKILLNIVFDFFYKHLVECTLFYMIFWSFFDYAKLQSGTLKPWLYIINGFIMAMIALYSIFTYLVPKNAGLETFDEIFNDNPNKIQPAPIVI